MLQELIDKIDTTKISHTLQNLKLSVPDIVSDKIAFTHLDDIRLSVVQLNYVGGDYVIQKLYISVNPFTEIALNNNYQFDVINFFFEKDKNIIYGYDAEGNQVAWYFINRSALDEDSQATYMKKDTGDIYIPASRLRDDKYEEIRQGWESTDRLLCYSQKVDGRIAFYITVNLDLDGTFDGIWKESAPPI